MPSDWLFYWMTLPSGLAVMAGAVALPFVVWAVLLGKARAEVGYKPLALAYLLTAIGLLLVNVGWSYLEFNSRVARDVLPEAQRWSTVAGWTVYMSILSLVIMLPLLGLFGVPPSATIVVQSPLKFAREQENEILAVSPHTCVAVLPDIC
jgi:hypothetical protein